MNSLSIDARFKALANNLQMIKQLSETAIPLTDYTVTRPDINTIEYGDHVAFGTSLMNSGKIAVQDIYMPPKAKVDSHYHDEIEHMIVYDGKIIFETKMGPVLLYPGDSITFKKGEPHDAYTESGCHFVAITIPASSGYPGVLNEGKK